VLAALQLHLTSPWSFAGMGVVGLIFVCFFYAWIALLYGGLVVTLSVVYHDQRRRKDTSLPTQLPATGAGLPPGTQPA
jgi:hypothetical protein